MTPSRVSDLFQIEHANLHLLREGLTWRMVLTDVMAH